MPRTNAPERILATVLFTDIVGSTELAARIGDRGWHDLVARHHRAVRAQLKQHRGREIDTAGDGFFAIFDRPAQAILCALDIIESLRQLGIEIRAGIHVGEVEVSGGRAGGIAVHTAARVLGSAQPGEVVVTATVRELVAGSGIEFAERGATTLKGIPGEWRLFTVVQRPGAMDAPSATPPATHEEASSLSGLVPRGWTLGVFAVLAFVGTAAAVTLLPGLWAAPVVPGPNTVGHIPPGGDTFDRAVHVGLQPTWMAFGAQAVWVLNFRDATISRIDAATGEVGATPAVGGTPTGVTSGADAVWVTTGFGQASGDVGSIVQFGARQAQVEDRIPIGNGVEAIAFGEGAVWVVDRTRELVLRVDTTNSHASPDEIPVGAAPGAIAVGAGSVWVTSTLDNTLWRIDPTTYETVATIPLLTSPTAIAVGAEAVWVTSESGDSVTRIDLTTNRPVTTMAIGNRPLGVATSPGAVWVAVSGDRVLAKLDSATDSVVASFAVDGAPVGVVVDGDGGVWVSVQAS